MTTIWNYRGDDRALWAVIAAIVGSVVAALAVLGIAGAGFAAMNGLLPF